MPRQVEQQIQRLGFERDPLAATAQSSLAAVELVIAEMKNVVGHDLAGGRDAINPLRFVLPQLLSWRRSEVSCGHLGRFAK